MVRREVEASASLTVRRLPEIVLVLVTVIWGGTFLVTQSALSDGGPFGILASRFSIGAAVLLIAFRRRFTGLRPDEIRAGLLIGAVTFASYTLQTTGLLYIASSKSAFITALYVPLVPILQLVLLGVSPRLSAWLGVTVSFAGLLVLSTGEGVGLTLGHGEWLTLGGAAMAALQIILISRWAPGVDPIRLAAVQLGVVAVLALVSLPLSGEPLPRLTGGFLLATVGLGVFGTALALGAMNWAQQTVSATRATIIYALEPVWGGLFGAAAGEPMTPATLLGSALIVGGVLVSELRWAVWPPLIGRWNLRTRQRGTRSEAGPARSG
jgi:drug/metabolite transporter (DMT)-like permease